MWPMLGSDSCKPGTSLDVHTDLNGTAYAELCDAVLENFSDDDGDGEREEICMNEGCSYESHPISVWATITLSTLVLVPVVWYLTSPTVRPPPWFKLILLGLSFLSSMFWMDLVAGEAVNVLTSLGA